MSDHQESANPFPGAQPYRVADRHRFFGREALVAKLAHQLLAHPSTTLFGPSGAGKSSLMQAGVIPRLEETHDFQVVRVDGWPPGEAPLPWLARALFDDLELGAPPPDLSPIEALDHAIVLAERRSEQPILIYLDQIEQLLFPERSEAEAEALIDGVHRLARAPIQGLQIVLSLREDYLGRFRDRARDRKELLAHGFRLGPMTVGEMVKAVCRTAAKGQPPQRWDEEQLRGLMREVRTPGESPSDAAEVQAAYAQIVCRALFQERAQGGAEGVIEAEPILRRYFDATLEALGPLAPAARRLLEDHLVTGDGSRTLRTEKELLRIVPAEKLGPILGALEGAAILHAEAHQGTRYFEIGHDWLARRVYEQRQQRERDEEQRRREEAQEAEFRRERAEVEARLAKARAQRRSLAILALAALAVAAGTAAMGLWALEQQRKAQAARSAADRERERAEETAIEASDARLLAGFRELKNGGQLAWATKLLAEVQRPAQARGWVALASEALAANTLEATLRGHEKALAAAAWSRDGKRVLTASADGTARVWSADGSGEPVVLDDHAGPITAASFSPDGARVLTGSEDGTTRLWSADGSGEPVVLDDHAGPVTAAAWSGDGARVVVASRDDATARVWSADGSGGIELRGHTGPLTVASFHPDGVRVLTGSEDGTARLWSAEGAGRPVVFRGHRGAMRFVALSPDGTRLVTASSDSTARIWEVSGKARPVTLEGHARDVLHAAWSPDGRRVATASADGTARVWSADGKGEPVVLSGHGQAVTFVGFRPDGRYVATASRDQTARIWPAEGGTPLVLSGHEGPVLSAAWSPDGARVLTGAAAAQEGGGSLDATARIWRPGWLASLPRERQGFYHSAFIGAGGDAVAAAYDDGTARVFRADGSGDPVVVGAGGGSASTVPVRGDKGWVVSAALSPDGSRIAIALLDGTARILRRDGTGEPVALAGHAGGVRAAAFSPEGGRVVTASDDRTARVWSADGTGKPVLLSGHTDGLTSAAWSPDGKRLVTTSMDHTARVWSADGSGEPVALTGHGGAIYAAAWSPDGARIVTASEDGTAQVWRAESGARAARFEHGSPVLRVIWSPDGARIATSSLRAGLRLWSADATGEPITLEAPVPLLAIAFVDGGQRILAVAENNTTRAWTIDVGALNRGLEGANADCLPPEMRGIYLGEPAAKARERYAACERAHRRAPVLLEGEEP
ncbi:hypothetical protein WMF26_33085 [Sorangium sp. So ce185]|uniref:nSTAND1 domain-containing NTPase n=1 Tax=Sorangium sp. So ce185 TaxID=3133287 RepID=UPI003F5E6939